MSSSQQTPSNSGHGQSSGSMSHTQDGAEAPQAQVEAHQPQNEAAQAQEQAPLGQADQIQDQVVQIQGQITLGRGHVYRGRHRPTRRQAVRIEAQIAVPQGNIVRRDPTRSLAFDNGHRGFVIRSSDPDDIRRLIERHLSPPNDGPQNSGPR